MACVSDIDLATLHRTRLEERLNYKLSFQQPNIYDGYTPVARPTTRVLRNSYDNKSKLNQCSKKSSNLGDLNDQSVMENLENKLNRLNFINKQKLLNRGESSSSLEDEEDYNYFSSTTRRRRSGTWP